MRHSPLEGQGECFLGLEAIHSDGREAGVVVTSNCLVLKRLRANQGPNRFGR